jgi:hypothetical protein
MFSSHYDLDFVLKPESIHYLGSHKCLSAPWYDYHHPIDGIRLIEP